MIKHLLGWKSKRKIIVFESDDWGSFRFKNKSIRDQFIKNYNPFQWMHYNDCFESYDDLIALEKVLKTVKDINNNSACFTFLMNPANPDFKKIEETNYEKYYYESFLQTLSKRNDGTQLLKWYNQAISESLIEVGFHGREHLNVQEWMKDLKDGNQLAHEGLKNRIWGQGKLKKSYKHTSYRSTFQMGSYDEMDSLKLNIKEGVELMNKMFNQNTTYFLAPDGPYHLHLNQALVNQGIQFIGLAKLHTNPLEPKWHQKKPFWLGKKTKEGLRVITRNVMFEPGSPKSKDWVNTAMQQIETAFKFKNPAVIGTHRANFVSALNQENRTNGLKQLAMLLQKITLKWPDVEFMLSSDLGKNLKKAN
jgi:hypothetical protein